MPFLLPDRKTAGAALAAAFAAAKTIRVPTTIEDDGDTIGTATTEITQTKQTEFTEFKQTYTIMQHQLKECLVTFTNLELRNDSLPYSAPEVAHT